MEQNSNQNLSSVPRLCKNNCGFFGSDAHDGMCSKCFKDSVKRTQSTQVASSTSLAQAQSPEKVESLSTASTTVANAVASASKSSLSTASTTVSEASLATAEKSSTDASSEAAAPEVSAAPESPAPSESGKKRKRCAVCRTKVGLTGFVCHCKGLYCSVHRYSDKHDCTYDYKGAGQEQIRKNNPVVKGQKIQRI